MASIEELVRKVRAYNPGADTDLLMRAYWYSSEAHGLQKRKSGSPYMEHPIQVAGILADMRMDVVTLAAALLHDTVEDTSVSTDDLRKRFGYELAFLVESLTKLAKMEFRSREQAQAENFRRMFLSMAEDIRVIIIKFADRLNNMSTLDHLSEDKQHRIATETLEVYAPLANRLGIGWLKSEFEDMSFKFLFPTLYQDISSKVKKKREEYERYVNALRASFTAKMAEAGLPGEVHARVKHYYSIYQKMQTQGIPFDQVHDILALRVISDSKTNCYGLLGLVHELWKPIPGKMKDYISVPKANGYQSLHTTVFGPGGERVEFQIRTEQMDRIAEEGIAAHWKYKEKGSQAVKLKDDQYVAWLREVVKTQGDADAEKFMARVKVDMLPDVIYVFTPQGDIKELPEGSGPLDFAFAIHTEVGNRCVGARVDGKMVSLKHKLHNGNVVDILTSPNQRPHRDWLSNVVTQRAKNRIKQWLKAEEQTRSVELGSHLLEAELRRHDLPMSLVKSKELEEIAKDLGVTGTEELFAAIGYGKVSSHQVVNRLRPHPHTPVAEEDLVKIKPKQKEQRGITIKGINDVMYHTAKCCYPIPGDLLAGFISRGKGVTVHRKDCPSLERLASDEARLIDVQWQPSSDISSYARVSIDTMDKPGIIAAMSAAISTAGVNISHLEAITSGQERKAKINLVLEVKDRTQLNAIIHKIAQIDGVLRVRRF